MRSPGGNYLISFTRTDPCSSSCSSFSPHFNRTWSMERGQAAIPVPMQGFLALPVSYACERIQLVRGDATSLVILMPWERLPPTRLTATPAGKRTHIYVARAPESRASGRRCMPWERLELSHPCGHMTLNHACLPIPAPGRIEG